MPFSHRDGKMNPNWWGSSSIIPMSIWILVMVSHFSWSGKRQSRGCTGGAARKQPLGFVTSRHICKLSTVLCEYKSFHTHKCFLKKIFIVVVYIFSVLCMHKIWVFLAIWCSNPSSAAVFTLPHISIQNNRLQMAPCLLAKRVAFQCCGRPPSNHS